MIDTKPLLNPEQASSMQDDMKRLEATIRSPYTDERYDKASASRQLQRLRQDYENQVARPPENPGDEDRLAKRANQLLSEILADGPCSQEEMRKAPPGAVEKHLQWERRNKLKLLEWKNIQKRLHANSGESGAWNFERHRPVASTLNMDNAFIPGKQIVLPPAMTGLPVTFSKDQIEALRSYDPRLAEMLGALDNSQRRTVKDLLEAAKGEGLGLAEEPKNPVFSEAGKAGAKKKRELSEAQRLAMAAGRAKAAANRAKKARE